RERRAPTTRRGLTRHNHPYPAARGGARVRAPPQLDWDYADRLQHTLKSNGSNQDTHFTYGADGQRVRKVYEHGGTREERIYLGGYEVYRRSANTPGASP